MSILVWVFFFFQTDFKEGWVTDSIMNYKSKGFRNTHLEMISFWTQMNLYEPIGQYVATI